MTFFRHLYCGKNKFGVLRRFQDHVGFLFSLFLVSLLRETRLNSNLKLLVDGFLPLLRIHTGVMSDSGTTPRPDDSGLASDTSSVPTLVPVLPLCLVAGSSTKGQDVGSYRPFLSCSDPTPSLPVGRSLSSVVTETRSTSQRQEGVEGFSETHDVHFGGGPGPVYPSRRRGREGEGPVTGAKTSCVSTGEVVTTFLRPVVKQ